MLTEVVKGLSFSQQTYLTLKNAIITNSLKQGEVLNEREIATALNVSRTPLREALQLLQQDGLITSVGKNKIVTSITWQDVEDIYHLRLVNEKLALDLASKRFNKANSIEMKNLLQEMRESSVKNLVEFVELDKTFHMYIAELSGNKKLFQLMQSLNDQWTRFGFITVHEDDKRLNETLMEHDKIYEACIDGDFEKAKTASAFHIQKWFSSLKGKL